MTATTTFFQPTTGEMPIPAQREWPPQDKWTYDDYRRLPDDGWRYEIIEGELYMSPAAEPIHQEYGGEMFAALRDFGKKRNAGKVYMAPIDVILPGLASPVQPDVLFIVKNRLHIVKKGRIEGAPDIIVEILSPSNWIIDRREKFNIYAKAGVREYWIVNPMVRTIELFVLREGRYELIGKYGVGEAVRSEVLPGFEVNVDEICPEQKLED
ncbi:Uma2 family endonuclease [candidate division KSB1 bacterium]|nr:Uma2 family endonuclease [candidate division KSB1 bacterium]